MFFRHSSAIWREFPQLVPGVLLADAIDAKADVQGLIEPLHTRARERLAAGPESELAEIGAWRRAFTQMGLKPTQYRCAAEALLRRFRRDGALPGLHPLVDFCNALSLAFAVPVPVLDLAGVDSSIGVRHARGDEEHWGFGGEVEHPEPGEVIFADAANHAHARRWTFRRGRKSTVGPGTGRVWFVAEGLHATAGADVSALLDALTEGVASRWGASRRAAVLTAATPQIELPS